MWLYMYTNNAKTVCISSFLRGVNLPHVTKCQLKAKTIKDKWQREICVVHLTVQYCVCKCV